MKTAYAQLIFNDEIVSFTESQFKEALGASRHCRCGSCLCCAVRSYWAKNQKYLGRQANCMYCKQLKPSSKDLPFFESRPDRETDVYYCGCKGWD